MLCYVLSPKYAQYKLYINLLKPEQISWQQLRSAYNHILLNVFDVLTRIYSAIKIKIKKIKSLGNVETEL